MGFEGRVQQISKWTHEARFKVGARVLFHALDPLDASALFSDIADCAIAALAQCASDEIAPSNALLAGAGIAILATGHYGSRGLNVGSGVEIAVFDAGGARGRSGQAASASARQLESALLGGLRGKPGWRKIYACATDGPAAGCEALQARLSEGAWSGRAPCWPRLVCCIGDGAERVSQSMSAAPREAPRPFSLARASRCGTQATAQHLAGRRSAGAGGASRGPRRHRGPDALLQALPRSRASLGPIRRHARRRAGGACRVRRDSDRPCDGTRCRVAADDAHPDTPLSARGGQARRGRPQAPAPLVRRGGGRGRLRRRRSSLGRRLCQGEGSLARLRRRGLAAQDCPWSGRMAILSWPLRLAHCRNAVANSVSGTSPAMKSCACTSPRLISSKASRMWSGVW